MEGTIGDNMGAGITGHIVGVGEIKVETEVGIGGEKYDVDGVGVGIQLE